MKYITTITLGLLFLQATQAQKAGTIKYLETIKLEVKEIEGMDFGDLMPSEISTNKELLFSDAISVYRESKDNVSEDIEMESDDGSFKMVLKTSEGEEILYTDIKGKKSIQQTSFMGKDFLIQEDLENPKWKITNEKIKYLGYVCQKATMTETIDAISEENDHTSEERDIVAWFTSEIPVAIGPRDYYQLPGAILMISIDEGKTEIKATEVLRGTPNKTELEKPTKGQKVSSQEFVNIMSEKMKEMQEMYGSGEQAIMIRG
ncbi:MAG: GLPGLI family protein [Saprospiraceae bacterium]|jgi:GLPGLI family protein